MAKRITVNTHDYPTQVRVRIHEKEHLMTMGELMMLFPSHTRELLLAVSGLGIPTQINNIHFCSDQFTMSESEIMNHDQALPRLVSWMDGFMAERYHHIRKQDGNDDVITASDLLVLADYKLGHAWCVDNGVNVPEALVFFEAMHTENRVYRTKHSSIHFSPMVEFSNLLEHIHEKYNVDIDHIVYTEVPATVAPAIFKVILGAMAHNGTLEQISPTMTYGGGKPTRI